jgi:polysaccharide deacetylase family protein (PEP-CTERM system associated)
VEDWYQPSNLDAIIGFHRWEGCESRLEQNVGCILNVLRHYKVQATFFILGWSAERFPEVVHQIQQDGHEIGTHGYRHALVYNQSPAEFARDMEQAMGVLEKLTGQPPLGHRAASFSITQQSWWALEVLHKLGIQYDSSIFPIRHHRYGVPESERFPHTIRVNETEIDEFPISTLRLGGKNIPFSGGGYFRLLPYRVIAAGIRWLNRRNQPAIVYLHPWEFDPHQPRVSMSRLMSWRCYSGLHKTEQKLHALLRKFHFAPAQEVLKYYLNRAQTQSCPVPAGEMSWKKVGGETP